jgi:hypothetical protein
MWVWGWSSVTTDSQREILEIRVQSIAPLTELILRKGKSYALFSHRRRWFHRIAYG